MNQYRLEIDSELDREGIITYLSELNLIDKNPKPQFSPSPSSIPIEKRLKLIEDPLIQIALINSVKEIILALIGLFAAKKIVLSFSIVNSKSGEAVRVSKNLNDKELDIICNKLEKSNYDTFVLSKDSIEKILDYAKKKKTKK